MKMVKLRQDSFDFSALPPCHQVQNCWPANEKCFAQKLFTQQNVHDTGHFNSGRYVYAVYKVLRKTLHFKFPKTVPTHMHRMGNFRVFI